MTLTEIAQYAGEKIGKTDADTLTFLQKSASLKLPPSLELCCLARDCHHLHLLGWHGQPELSPLAPTWKTRYP
jgi:hypothetical protein